MLSRRFFDRLAAPKRMVVLDGASHMPTEHPGVDQLEAAVLELVDRVASEVSQGQAAAPGGIASTIAPSRGVAPRPVGMN